VLNHDWIGTEHLMLGLIGEGSGMAAQVLESLEVPLEGARWLVEQTIGRGEQAPSGHQPDPDGPDQQAVTLRRETAAAVDMQEFETATGVARP
jgi:ATP-dependent Clp protease ATP-binding subunit ClpA